MQIYPPKLVKHFPKERTELFELAKDIKEITMLPEEREEKYAKM